MARAQQSFAFKLRIDQTRAVDLLDKMATYVRVVEAGSLSAAAKQLRISAAAVSRQISTLEAELRVELIHRTTRRMTITAAGERYYERCLRILRDVDDAQQIGRNGALEGVLKLSVPVTFGLATLMPVMRTFKQKHPSLRIDLRLEDRMVDLVLDGVDVALRTGSKPPENTEIVAHRLFSSERVLVAAPSYLKRRGLPKSPEMLPKHDALSHVYDAPGDVWHLHDGEQAKRVHLNVAISSNAGHVLRDLAIAGAGIALLPDWFVRDAVARGELRVLCPGWRSQSVVVHALHRTVHRGEQRVRALIAHLKAAYQELGQTR